MRVLVIGTGFGGRVVAGAYRDAGCGVDVVSPWDADAVSKAIAAVPTWCRCTRRRSCTMPTSWLRSIEAPLCSATSRSGATRPKHSPCATGLTKMMLLNYLNFEFRRFPARVKARALVGQGAIGTPQHVSWLFVGNGLRPQVHRWLFDRELAGGWVGAWGSHCIDTLRWLLESEVATCSAVLRTETASRPDALGVEHPSSAEDAFSAWFTMDNGCTASVDTAYSTPVALPQTVHVLGNEGAIEVRNDQTVSLRRPGEATETFSFPPGDGDPHSPGLVPWLADVVQAVGSGLQLSPPSMTVSP